MHDMLSELTIARVKAETDNQIDWLQSLLDTLKSGDTATAIESIEGAIAILQPSTARDLENVNV